MFNAIGRVAAIALSVVAGLAACGGEDPAKPSYTISVTVSGLVAGRTVVLRNNGGSDLPLSANGTANFGMALASGSAYAVTVFTQPAGQMCTVANGTGTVGSANVTNITVICTPLTYTVGGTVNGLGAGKTLVLRNNGGNDLTIAANGAFSFATAVASGAAYAVTVATQPAGQVCSIASGAGTIVSANITNVTINCSTLSYSVGGAVTGLLANGSLVLRNNAGNDVQIFANVGFTFSIPVASGATYAVTVFTQPVGQTCAVANGTGTIVAANVSNVAVTCI